MTNTTNTERLKPCPFCGQPGFLSKAGSPEWFSVGCSGLFGCPAYLRAQVHRTESAAIAAWNTRAALAEAESLGAARARDAEAELNCAEEALDGYAVDLALEQTSFDCIGDYIKAVVDATRAEAAGQEVPLSELLRPACRYISDVLASDAVPSEKHVARIVMHLLPLDMLTAAPEAPAAPAVAEPVAYVELTDAECDEFRRHQGDFNSMLRATHRAGYSRVVVSQPAPREPLTADEETKNKYGEWTHTIKGQPVSDNVPLKHECDGGSDYCMHCGIDMTGPYGSTPCDGLEQARRRQIKPETVAVFGCDAEARGLGACQQWCQGLQCPYTRSAAGDERTHGIGADREGG